MLEKMNNFGILDITGVVLIATAAGLGASVALLAPVLSFAAPIHIILATVLLASLGAILQGISANMTANELDPEMPEEEERFSEQWHREMVDRAYRQGYAEGRSRGFKQGLDKGADLTRRTSGSNRNQRSQKRTGVSDQKTPPDNQNQRDRSECETEEEFE
jgi:hypothetical protein